LVLAVAPHRSDCLEENGKQMNSLSLAAKLSRVLTSRFIRELGGGAAAAPFFSVRWRD
jgi:hypothetical protein